MESWTVAQCAFAVKVFYKNSDSSVIVQRESRSEFGIHHNRAVPSAHAIKTWVRNFEATGSTLKKSGSVKTICTPKNIAVVREAIERSQQNGVDFFHWPLTTSIFPGVHTVFTLPPFCSVGPVALKF